ncbi:MAG: HipA domain-containing protein [Actinobacteria bacterium]|nr:HipA domain-containing protein [Actinomycetota bacterium]
MRSFPLLLALGRDLSGAVEVRPDVDISSLVDRPEGWVHDAGSDRPRLAFSLAGVQLKFSMLREGRRFTLPMSGVGGQWIVKLPDRTFRDVPSNEHAMMRWASAAGCDVPATELVTGADIGLPESLVAATEPVFAIRRFDRADDRRVHVEDLAQVREVAPRYKYDNSSYDAIGRVIRTVAGDAAFEEYIRRLVLVVAMGNGDAHLKNWSLIYRDGITAELAPAYDMVSVTAYEQFTADRLAFRLGGERSFSAVHRGHFRRLAGSAEADVDRIVDVVDEAIARLHEAWPAVVREYPVPDFVRRHISDRLTELPLLKGV